LVRLIDAAQLFALARTSNARGGSSSGSSNNGSDGSSDGRRSGNVDVDVRPPPSARRFLAWADLQAALVGVRPSELAELDVRRFPSPAQGGPSWADVGGYLLACRFFPFRLNGFLLAQALCFFSGIGLEVLLLVCVVEV
jgi:hypothetical protein